MTWNDVCKIIIVLITSGGIVWWVIAMSIKFSVNFIAERLQKKYELRLNEEFEKFRVGLDKKNYISRAKFDKEFIIYQELSEKVMNMIDDNVKLFSTDQRPEDKDERQKFLIERRNNAVQSYNIASKAIYANAPFIPEEFFDLFSDVKKQCLQQIGFYELYELRPYEFHNEDQVSKCHKQNEEVRKKVDEIISKIREYLTNLDVYER